MAVGEDRQAMGQGFQEDTAEAFLQGGENENVGGTIEVKDGLAGDGTRTASLAPEQALGESQHGWGMLVHGADQLKERPGLRQASDFFEQVVHSFLGPAEPADA